MKVASRLLLVGALMLSACTVPTGPVEVTIFNRVAEGQAYGNGSFTVRSGDGTADELLSLSPYLAAVTREMGRVGYSERAAGSDVVAEVRVERVEIVGNRRSPVSVGVGGSTGSYGSGVGVGLGFNLGGGDQARIETQLAVRILRRSDNVVIWEGRAVQSAGKTSPAAQPGIAASKLAESLFKDFPGRSGETIEVP